MQQSTLWVSSFGLVKDQQIPIFLSAMLGRKFSAIRHIRYACDQNIAHDDVVIGWGRKTSSNQAYTFSKRHNLPFFALEDGFVAFSGHANKNKRLSLIVDSEGVYYDSSSSSALEKLLLTVNTWCDDALLVRANHLIDLIKHYGISKYNQRRSCLPDWLVKLKHEKPLVLLLDQTHGDVSISCGGATSETFMQMLRSAREKFPESALVVKTHPDVIHGKKRSCFENSVFYAEDVYLLADDVHLPSLFAAVTDVFTVTSQLGFEALIYGKQVHCFGLPFYAGWGLTHDNHLLDRRSIQLSLPQLVAAAMIRYPTYLHPDTQQMCDIEQVIDTMLPQLENKPPVDVCYVYGFSLWKRSFVKDFIANKAMQVKFIQNQKKLLKVANTNTAVLLWGRNHELLQAKLKEQNIPVWVMEDGFIRSVGLGADLRLPSSLVIDEQGIYYDSLAPSDIVTAIKNQALNMLQEQRIKELLKQLIDLNISKYNVGQQDVENLYAQKNHSSLQWILVPGQFEKDKSITYSQSAIKSNLALLQKVREDHPDAFVIFKEHPDLYSGVREGALGEATACKYADLYVADVDITALLALVDKVCTISSLTGFEALLRGVLVKTYGVPFYAGWGLTEDEVIPPNRQVNKTLYELAYAALIAYPRYMDWDLRKLTTPEVVISKLLQQKHENNGQRMNSSWSARQARKIKYLYQSFIRR